jgi:hypothetical protein
LLALAHPDAVVDTQLLALLADPPASHTDEHTFDREYGWQ